MKVDILAIGIHPDDVELSCGGTLLKHKADGKKFAIIDLTRGELGTRGNATLRTQEAIKAAQLLGAETRVQLDLPDGFFSNDKESLLKIITQIRCFKPDIVLCNAIRDRHPDHGKAAQLESDACFYSGLEKIETFFEDKKQDCWRPSAVYHYIQDYALEPDFVVDVSSFVDKKIEAIMAFSSQFYNSESSEPITPISGKEFMDSVKAKMQVHGRPAGMLYAEGFTSSRIFGVKSLFSLI